MLFIQNDVFIQEKNILPNCSCRIAYVIFIESCFVICKEVSLYILYHIACIMICIVSVVSHIVLALMSLCMLETRPKGAKVKMT